MSLTGRACSRRSSPRKAATKPAGESAIGGRLYLVYLIAAQYIRNSRGRNVNQSLILQYLEAFGDFRAGLFGGNVEGAQGLFQQRV
ncbi:MAG: hypothetical protein P8Y48_13290, partial [Novosphingobium sp.]